MADEDKADAPRDGTAWKSGQVIAAAVAAFATIFAAVLGLIAVKSDDSEPGDGNPSSPSNGTSTTVEEAVFVLSTSYAQRSGGVLLIQVVGRARRDLANLESVYAIVRPKNAATTWWVSKGVKLGPEREWSTDVEAKPEPGQDLEVIALTAFDSSSSEPVPFPTEREGFPTGPPPSTAGATPSTASATPSTASATPSTPNPGATPSTSWEDEIRSQLERDGPSAPPVIDHGQPLLLPAPPGGW
jgi:hypothetical protein